MVIVDTSIWVDHLRKANQHLEHLLNNAEVACHRYIIGELACGNIRNRNEILSLLQSLPTAPIVDFIEYLNFIEMHDLMGRGVGFVDIHLLASAKLSGLPLWTLDTRLQSVSIALNVQYN